MKILFMIFTLLSIVPVTAQVGAAFNYQGELLDNGSPANDTYDFIIDAYTTETGNNMIDTLDFNNISVVNGLFTISNIDFGSSLLGNTIWLQINIRKTGESGNFEILLSRQKIYKAPYAYESDFAKNATIADEAFSLSPNGANTNDVLTFNGSQWAAKTGSWQYQNNVLSTTNNNIIDKVVIGSSTPSSQPARLTVNSQSNGKITHFEGTSGIYNEYRENNVAKGYVGSFQNGIFNAGTNEDDFEIGTSSSNTTGNMHLTISAVPRLTVTNNGMVGIGNTSPTGKFQVDSDSLIVTTGDFVGVGTTIPDAKLEVDAASNVGKSFSVKNNGTEKLTVHQNGGSSVGSGISPPVDGLYVEGSVKQSSSANGMLKYMVRVRCLQSGSSVTSSYNGINNGTVSITDEGVAGRCNIHFNTNINTRYWQVTAVSANGNHNANCHTLVSNSQLRCQRTLSGANNDGDIMILVY